MPMLLVGFNQTVMMTLNMVIIASMIGAGGLGFDVLLALRQLDIGRGFEAGAAIVVLAIMLDRQGRALASGWSSGQERRAGVLRDGLGIVAWLALTTVLGLWNAPLGKFPAALQVTTGSVLNDFVTWINVNFFDTIEAVRVAVLMNLMNPIRIFLTTAPGWRWPARWRWPRLSWAGCACSVRVFVLGFCWSPACGKDEDDALSVPVGRHRLRGRRPAAGHGRRALAPVRACAELWVELLQTMPSFVYLIPSSCCSGSAT